MSLRLLKHHRRNLVRFSCHHCTVKRQMVWDKGIEASRRRRSACLVRGALCTLSAAREVVPPSSHFLSRLGKLATLPAESQDLMLAVASFTCPRTTTNKKERKQLKTTVHIAKVENVVQQVFGFKGESTLNAQVCPDVFLPQKRCYVTQNTICCVHSSICQKLNWRENCCNTVNSCHRSKQQTRHGARFYAN